MLYKVVSPHPASVQGLVLQLGDLEEGVSHGVPGVGVELGRGHGARAGGGEVHAVDGLVQDGPR